MLTEPSISISSILHSISTHYGLEVTSLAFMKGGECSWGYKVESSDHKIYFLKIHTGIQSPDIRLQVLLRLHEECGINSIVYPIKTKTNQAFFFLDSYPTAMFPFINGNIVADTPLDTDQQFELGVLLGKLHKADEVIGKLELKETFSLDFKTSLIRCLSDFSSEEENKEEKEARVLLQINKEKIIQKLDVLEEISNSLKEKRIEFVICHSDPHGWNIMVDEQRKIYLVDWDGVLLAPKEKDFFMIENTPSLTEGYESIVGKFTLDENILKFYRIRWNLSEIEDWSNRLLYGNENEIQRIHYLDSLKSEISNL